MKKTTISLLTLATLITAGHAATITWSATPYVNTPDPLKDVMGVDQFDQSGTMVFAVNIGGSDQTLDQTNDIAFTASDANLTTTLATNFGGYHNSAVGGNNNISSTGSYTNTGSVNVTLNNLIMGNQYRIQALVMDGRSVSSGRTTSFGGNDLGRFAFGVSAVTWGDGLLVTGTFTADGTSQVFTQEIFNSNGTSAGGQLNAIVLHDLGAVPEPSSLFLLGIGSLGLLRRRR